MPLPKGRNPNYFNQPVAKAYNPTLRDKAAGLLSGLFGDTYQTNLFSRGLLGSSGLGGGQGPIAGMGLLDMTPLGAAFALEEAGRKIGRGDRVGGVADAALAVVPIPAAAKGARSLDDIVKRAKGLGVDLSVSDGRNVVVSKIVVDPSRRNSGLGTQVMRDVLDYADANGKTVALTPSSHFGGNTARLKNFYSDMGFVENKGRAKDFSTMESMYRQPAQSTEPKR